MKIILTGSTGMVGKGVLLECLEDPSIDTVLVVNRKPIGMTHPKLKEVLLKDFSKVETIRGDLEGYDACFYCMGVSAVGMNEEDYTKITFGLAKQFADVLYELNSNMVFNYVSGMGTDSSESGRQMWARVKGRTENYILNIGFKKAIMFRPGVILAEKGIRSKTRMYEIAYTILRPIFPLLKMLPSITTTTKVGLAMLATLILNVDKTHLENSDINQLAERLSKSRESSQKEV